MAVEKTKDPVTRKPITIVSGIVSAVYFNPLKEVKDRGKDGKSWIPTHAIALVVDGAKVNLGMTDKEKLRVKDVDDQYQDVVKGAEVSIVVTEGEPYNGKPQYNAYSSAVTVLTPAPESAEKPQGGKPDFTPKQKADPTELIAGNARNTAAILVRRFGVDFNQGISYAAQVAHNAKVEYAATDSKMTSYQVGVSVGEAVKVAAELAESLEAVPDYITAYLAEQVPYSLDVVRGLPNDKEYVTPELPGDAPKEKPKATTKAKPAVKAKEASVESQEASQPDFDDSDIPF